MKQSKNLICTLTALAMMTGAVVAGPTGTASAQTIDISSTGATQAATNTAAITNGGALGGQSGTLGFTITGPGSVAGISSTGAVNSVGVTQNTATNIYGSSSSSSPPVTMGVAQTATNNGSVGVTGSMVLTTISGAGSVASISSTGAANAISVIMNRN